MKVSFLGKMLMADIAFRTGKRFLKKRSEMKQTQQSLRGNDNYFGYSKAEAVSLINAVFDNEVFQAKWARDPSLASAWVLTLRNDEFMNTFGFRKPAPIGVL